MSGRKAEEIKDLEQYDFDKLSKTHSNPRERQRYLAFAHIRDGSSFTAAAAAVRVSHFQNLMLMFCNTIIFIIFNDINAFNKKIITGFIKINTFWADPFYPDAHLEFFIANTRNKP